MEKKTLETNKKSWKNMVEGITMALAVITSILVVSSILIGIIHIDRTGELLLPNRPGILASILSAITFLSGSIIYRSTKVKQIKIFLPIFPVIALILLFLSI